MPSPCHDALPPHSLRSHFVKLGAPDEELAAKSMRELEAHSQVGLLSCCELVCC